MVLLIFLQHFNYYGNAEIESKLLSHDGWQDFEVCSIKNLLDSFGSTCSLRVLYGAITVSSDF